jgi:L-ribulose-5-phosphate 4-epimerase
MTEGYIKFTPNWIKEPITIGAELFSEINRVRSVLMAKGFLGVLPNGIGFGNISVRRGASDLFFITGSATGGIPVLVMEHMALVESSDIERNSLTSRGLTAASSESMSHAIIYQTVAEANAVIHIHHAGLWKDNFNQLPTTDPKVEYGTPEMAFSLKNLIVEKQMKAGILLMGGHEDGLIAFAADLAGAAELLLTL